MQPAASAGADASPAAQAAAVSPELVQLAHRLAEAAATVTTRYFRTPVPVDVKQDASPVTIADREAEAAMRAILATECPDHGIFGEEQGFLAGGTDSEYLWVIDPIDGTKSFITGGRGVPAPAVAAAHVAHAASDGRHLWGWCL